LITGEINQFPAFRNEMMARRELMRISSPQYQYEEQKKIVESNTAARRMGMPEGALEEQIRRRDNRLRLSLAQGGLESFRMGLLGEAKEDNPLYTRARSEFAYSLSQQMRQHLIQRQQINLESIGKTITEGTGGVRGTDIGYQFNQLLPILKSLVEQGKFTEAGGQLNKFMNQRNFNLLAPQQQQAYNEAIEQFKFIYKEMGQTATKADTQALSTFKYGTMQGGFEAVDSTLKDIKAILNPEDMAKTADNIVSKYTTMINNVSQQIDGFVNKLIGLSNAKITKEMQETINVAVNAQVEATGDKGAIRLIDFEQLREQVRLIVKKMIENGKNPGSPPPESKKEPPKTPNNIWRVGAM
jgi:hypothetical protein